jgi:hypothetical protein
VARPQHYYGLNHLHYRTASTYRRARIFGSERFKGHFTKTLNGLLSGPPHKENGKRCRRQIDNVHLGESYRG